jgi:hypothetical protein
MRGIPFYCERVLCAVWLEPVRPAEGGQSHRPLIPAMLPAVCASLRPATPELSNCIRH